MENDVINIEISRKGRNFKGKLLTEDNLKASTLVMWKRRLYETGNRYGTMVSLWLHKTFIAVVPIKHVSLAKILRWRKSKNEKENK